MNESINSYALGLLKTTGCDKGCYRECRLTDVIDDLRIYEEKQKESLPFPMADIAAELIKIGNMQPFYPDDGRGTEGMCPNGDICHWGYDELYQDAEQMLRKLLKDHKPFDTGWHGSNKELTSCRIRSNGSSLLIKVCCEMDDFPEILGDYEFPNFVEEKMDEYKEIWVNDEWNSTYSCEKEIPISTYESMIETLCELYREASSVLHEWYIEYGRAIGAKISK